MSLERELRLLPIAWPETPALRPELAPRRSRRPLVLALAALLVAIAVAFAVPPARSAILRFFHLKGVTVERVARLPEASRRSLEAGLGPERSLDEAARIAGFPPVLPPGVEARRAYALPGVIAIPIGDGRLLTELSAIDLGLSKKVAGGATTVEPVRVGDGDGIWIEGGPHVLAYYDRARRPIFETIRLAGNTLLWQHGDRTFRLEGPLTKEQALRLAESIRTDKA